ncbi:PREDICTED: uncharacterized protein LOC103343214 [Prunus mume]|uniref:Uncharacterized protein LOC103343214 n=1 Tax=Prunus mume TaxID=102107 RepID=A0ABM0PVF6_PRUMU|nr:PREDICTED: uncharacterized protein LOC103343214 [Prunus mume]
MEKVCYLDNVAEDFLSLVDLRQVEKGLGYNVDISNPKPNLEIWYRKGGTHGVGGLELINFDAKLIDMLGQMPCKRIVVLYYIKVGNSNIVWSQASFGCQGLDGADNYAEVQHNVQVEDEIEVQEKNKDEAKVVDSEEDDGEFVNSDYEFNEEEFGFKTVEVPVHEGAEDTMNDSNEGPTFLAPGEVSSDGEHTSDFDTESEVDGDDMEGQVLKKALREYSIIHGRKLFFEKNDKMRVKAICRGGLKCPFVLYASQLNQDVQTFAIKKLSLEHTCERVEKLKFANPKWICERFSSKIKRNTYWNLKAFQGEVLESYHVRVSKTQVYRAKRLVKAQIEGNYIQQYARLWDYVEQLKNTNKGVDGNNGLFPIAYAVAEIENKDSWIWFLSLLIEDLGITNGLSWAFICDKQKGLILAIAYVLPIAEIRMCVRHLYNNFRATHLGLTLKHML